MFWKKNKATGVLVLSGVLYLAVQPYQSGFVGGLFASGCLAALIGGLADWFAVSALFRRPLGIPWRTEIIKRNRARLFAEIIRFTADDLLSVNHIKQILGRYQTAELLLAFLENSKGKEKLGSLVAACLEDMAKGLNDEETKEHIVCVLRAARADIFDRTAYLRLLEVIKAKRYDDRTVDFLLEKLMDIVREERIKEVLADLIEEIKRAYEGDSARRMIMGAMAQVDAVSLAQIAQAQIVKYLSSLKEHDHAHRVFFRAWLYEKAEGEAVFAQVKQWWNTFALEEKILARLYESGDEGRREMTCFFIGKLETVMEDNIAALKSDAEMKDAIDGKLKAWLCSLLAQHHAFIRHHVETRLQSFSEEELVAFIEDKIAEDLQMIRINGSLVGALAGMALYLISFAVERMWGQ